MSDTKGKVPNIVAIDVIKKNGVDVEKLKELITKGVGAEFTTYYYYTILRMHCTGLDGEGIKEIVEEARIEDRNHFEAMVPRLYELGGSLPRDIRKFADQAGCPDAYLPDNWENLTSIIEVLLGAEQCAIRSWGEVCDMTAGKDPRTYDIAQTIMQEEIEHEAWFIELLSKRPSGHFRRRLCWAVASCWTTRRTHSSIKYYFFLFCYSKQRIALIVIVFIVHSGASTYDAGLI